jgi:ABC-type transport system involved in multi-copper enzyme maturation permease subunit
MSVIIVSITCNEFVFKTFRQNAIDGLTKQQLIISKFWVILLLSAFIALYTFLVSAITGLVYTDFSEIMDGVSSIGIYFIQTVGYFSLAFLFAVLMKKPSLAIIVFILTILFDGITIGLAVPASVFVYFPTEVFSNLTPFPFFKEIIDNAKNGGVQIVQLSYTVGVILSLIYSAIILFVSYKILQKRDL